MPPFSFEGEVDGAKWKHLVLAGLGHLAPELGAWLRRGSERV